MEFSFAFLFLFLSSILLIVVIWVLDLCHCSTLLVYLLGVFLFIYFINKISYVTHQNKKKKKCWHIGFVVFWINLFLILRILLLEGDGFLIPFSLLMNVWIVE